MDDLGPRIAYLAVEEGTPAYDPDGEQVGVVDHVLAEEDADIFDGVVIETVPGKRLFADVEQVADLHERGVILKVGRDELHEPQERPAVMEAQPEDTVESPLHARLRRAWDRISGRR